MQSETARLQWIYGISASQQKRREGGARPVGAESSAWERGWNSVAPTLATKCGAAAELSEGAGRAARVAIPRQHRLGHSLCAEWVSETEATGAPGCPWQETFCLAAAERRRQQACSDPRARAGSALVQVASTSVNATEINRRIARGL